VAPARLTAGGLATQGIGPMSHVKLIPLSQGLWTLVDAIDYDRLTRVKWYAWEANGGAFYAIRQVYTAGIQSTERLHRAVMKAPAGVDVDHRSGDTLDNRRANLRLAPFQNQWNQALHTNNSSGWKGVSWYKRSRRWMAFIRVNGKRHHLGYFADPLDAARAYDIAAVKLHGEYARLNFPEHQP
jgi:AP2 domain-containing protein/HNH endonuclease